MNAKQIVYGFPGSLLTRLYGEYKGHGLVQSPELEDIGNIFRSGEHIWYDHHAFENEKRCLYSFTGEACPFSDPFDENRDIDFEEYDVNPLSQNLKIKLLSVYCPENVLVFLNQTKWITFLRI